MGKRSTEKSQQHKNPGAKYCADSISLDTSIHIYIYTYYAHTMLDFLYLPDFFVEFLVFDG